MQEIKYTLKGTVEKPSELDGEVVIKVPGYIERMNLLRELKTQTVVGESKALEAVIKNDLGEAVDSLIYMYGVASKYIVSLDLIHKVSGLKYTKFQDMEYLSCFQDFFMEIAGIVLKGEVAGNASGKQ